MNHLSCELGAHRRIRIVYAIDSLIRGGTELQLVELISRLDRQKYEPYLLTIRPSDPSLAPRDCRMLPWHVPRLLSPGGFIATFRLAQLFRRERIEVVHTFFQDSTVIAGAAAFLARVPVRLAALRDMAFWGNKSQRILMTAAYKLMTEYVANANAVKQHFVETFGLCHDKVSVIENGIDVDGLSFRLPADPVRNIAIVGNMSRRVKRIDLFIRAAAIVAKAFPEISFHVIGEGELRAELEGLATSLGIGNSVRFPGSVQNIPTYLSDIDIGVICSDSEGLSNAVLEYMFKGCAVIATAVGGNTELIDTRRTGVIVPPGDAMALADAMKVLIADADLREKLARNARTWAETRFNWKKCLASYDAIYRVRQI